MIWRQKFCLVLVFIKTMFIHPGVAIRMNLFMKIQWNGSQQMSQKGFCSHSDVPHFAEHQKVLYVRKQNKSEDLPFESLHTADHMELSLQA